MRRWQVFWLAMLVGAGFGAFLLWRHAANAPYRRTAIRQPDSIAVTGDSLTFLAWSDQHVSYDGNAPNLTAAIDAMNAIEGTPYPPEVGGSVARPAFVLGCGDCTDWPTRAAVNAFARATERLRYVSYNAIGNHDVGDDDYTSLMARWITARHGGASYTFTAGRVRFIVLSHHFNSKEQIEPAAQVRLREQLALDPNRPTVVVTHYSMEAISNKEQFASCFESGNVIICLGGHHHRASAGEWQGHPYYQLPSPTTSSEFCVVRITSDRVLVLAYNHAMRRWVDRADCRLDVAIRAASGSR